MPTYTDPFAPGTPAYQYPTDWNAANYAATPQMSQLATQINTQNQAAQQAANAGRLGPQGQATQAAALNNAQLETEGLLDPATEAMLQQGIAESGTASGMGVDSANLASAYRRALGLDITATEQAGETSYLNLLAANPSAPIFGEENLLVSPAQPAQQAADPTTTGTGANPLAAPAATPAPAGGGLRISPSPAVATPAQANILGQAGSGNYGGAVAGAAPATGADTGASVADPFDPNSYDPSTGLGLDPITGSMWDPGTETAYNPTSGMTYDPVSGAAIYTGEPPTPTSLDPSTWLDSILNQAGVPGEETVPADTTYSAPDDTDVYNYGLPSWDETP